METLKLILIYGAAGAGANILYHWLKSVFFSKRLTYREFLKIWVYILPQTVTHKDIENIFNLIDSYFLGIKCAEMRGMKRGELFYDDELDSPNIAFDDGSYGAGFHCGDVLEVYDPQDGRWNERMLEYDDARDDWYFYRFGAIPAKAEIRV